MEVGAFREGRRLVGNSEPHVWAMRLACGERAEMVSWVPQRGAMGESMKMYLGALRRKLVAAHFGVFSIRTEACFTLKSEVIRGDFPVAMLGESAITEGVLPLWLHRFSLGHP